MQKTILIVEDHDDSRNALKYLLEGQGYKVVEAHNGTEAIKAADQQMPDLILMDLALPEVDGLTVTKTIREMESNSTVPIIAVTAFWSFYYRQAKELGFNDIIDKPIDHLKLLKTLKQYLDN